jgi:hypothetical protein
MKLYFDEAGNTGTDLFNRDQPVASLASTSLDAAECKDLLLPLLRQGQTEAKYSVLRRTARGQEALLRFFSSDRLTRSTTKALVADKRFSVVAQLVDKLIEPAAYEDGLDLYDGDGQIAYANVLHFAGPDMLPDGRWDNVLKAFLAAVRRPSDETYEALEFVLRGALQYALMHSELAEPIFGLMRAPDNLHRYLDPFIGTASFDPMPNLFASLVNYWMRQSDERFDVIHDQSKPLQQSEPHLRLLMTQASSRQVGYGDRKVELPLRISELTFADSKLHPSLQVADLVAGAAMDLFCVLLGHREGTPYHEALRSSCFTDLIIDGIVPSSDITRENEAQVGETSIVDGTTSFIREAKAVREE